jgi:peptidyl-dipeptidase Dcp
MLLESRRFPIAGIAFLAAGAALLCAGPASAAAPASASAENPFFSPSPLQYQTPPFDRIQDSDYGPALEEGMKQQIAEIDAIANDPAPPTFENTLVAMEKSGQVLNRVAKVFFNLTQSNIDDAMKKVRAEEAPKLAAHQDAIFLNPKLWARVKTLWTSGIA